MSDPDCLAFVAAIEEGDFDKAIQLLAQDDEKKLIQPIGVLQVTALQVAAWQGHIVLLNQLLDKGANVSGVDKIGRTALYFAAHCGHADVTRRLLECEGADINTQVGVYSCSRDMHFQSTVVGRELPLPVCWGRSPLHQAVKNNHADVVRILVNVGADVNIKDERSITPLLLAGSGVNRNDPDEMRKFFEIVTVLVSAKAYVNSVHTETGTTVLHHAAMLGSVETIEVLLKHNAWPMYKCKKFGSTPFHIAASIGDTKTLVVLLKAIQPHNIDTHDKMSRTALHRAAFHGHCECVRVLINYGANLAAAMKNGVTVVKNIFAHIPRPVEFLTDILDSCVHTTNNSYERYENITVDFTILAPKYQIQMAVVTNIIDAASDMSQLTILQHPLVETFLRLKWARLRILFFLLVLVHSSFVVCLSVFALMFIKNNTADILPIPWILSVCSIFLLVHNFVQLLLEPKHYIKQVETWLSILCAIMSLTAAIGSEFTHCTKEEIEKRQCAQWILHYLCIAILLSWIQTMLLIGRFPMWGYYALMFSTVLKNIVKVILAFGCLIIGFALSFAIMFRGKDQFDNFWKAVLSTVVMMTGEYDYTDLFASTDDNKNSTDNNADNIEGFLPITTRIVFFSFIIFTSIGLVNLMLGLAVSDIQGLEKEGHILRLLKQAEFVAHLERLTSHKIFRGNWILPRLRKWIYSRRDIPTSITLSSRSNYFHQFKDLHSVIPTHLKEALYLLAIKTPWNNNSEEEKSLRSDDVDLVSMINNLEEQIRELKIYCYRKRTVYKIGNDHYDTFPENNMQEDYNTINL